MLSTVASRGASRDGVHVQVVVRCRPLNAKESARNVQSVVACGDSDVCVEDRTQSFKKYTFDRVFGTESSQETVFDAAIKPFVENVLEGFNCTIFAYGQTGTGKTYTMGGDASDITHSGELPAEAGIIPRTVKRIFQKLQGSDSTVTVNFLELYNEELTDLLDPWLDQVDKDGHRKKKVMKIMEDQQIEAGTKLRRGIQLAPFPEDCVVTNEAEILEILKRGSAQRQTAETLLNEKSSRSHSIFVISIHMKETKPTGEDVIKIGKLNLVDLAGSENISRAGSNRKEERQREAGSINQSLLTLGRVINALVDKSAHVPYRDSNLTRLLRDSLGGSTKTLMIATISPGECSQEETFKTLDYAKRAKSIKNKPEVNQRISKTDLVKDLHAEIKRLKEELVCQRRKEGVIVLPLEKHAQNEVDRKEMLKEIDTTRDQLKDLQQQNEEVQLEKSVLESEKSALSEKLNSLEEQFREQTGKLRDQIYWSETYHKNCQELNAQLQSQSSNLDQTMTALSTHKAALQALGKRFESNADVSQEMVQTVKQRVDAVCSFLDSAVRDCQSKTQALLLECGAKKLKREEAAQKLSTCAKGALQLQEATQTNMAELWTLTKTEMDEQIQKCQEQYRQLTVGAAGIVQEGFENVLAAAAEQNQSWKGTLDHIQAQEHARTAEMRCAQERLEERKRKMESLKQEAEDTQAATLQSIQHTTAAILQEAMAKCLSEAMPKILHTTAQAFHPSQSMMTELTSAVTEVDDAVGRLAQQELKIGETPSQTAPDVHSIAQSTLSKLKATGDAILPRVDAAHAVEQAQRRCDHTQKEAAAKLAALQEQLHAHFAAEDAMGAITESSFKTLSATAQTLAQSCSQHLVAVHDDLHQQESRFDWTEPDLLLDASSSDASPSKSSDGVMQESDRENSLHPPPRLLRKAKRSRAAVDPSSMP